MPTVVEHDLSRDGSVAVNVAAVIVNFQGWRDTVACVRSLLSADVCPEHVVVVDNHSQDDSWLQLRSALCTGDDTVCVLDAAFESNAPGTVVIRFSSHMKLVLIRAETNRGFGAGNNVGTRYLANQGYRGYVWILNNDTVDVAGALDALRRQAIVKPLPLFFGTTLVECYDHDRIQACGANISCPALKPHHLYAGESLSALSTRLSSVSADYPIGASFFIHSNCWPLTDLFDERYFLFFEELDLMHRLGLNKVEVLTGVAVAHKGGGSTGGGGHATRWTRLTDYHSIRSRILYARRLGIVQTAAAIAVGLMIGLRRFGQGGLSATVNAWRGVLGALRT